MISHPLELAARLRPVPASWDWLHFTNVGLLGLFFAIFHAPQIVAPGVRVETSSGPRPLRLPEVPAAVEQGGAPSLVISVVGRDLVFTADGKYTFAEIRRWLMARGRKAEGGERPRLLVRADVGVALGDLAELFSAADEAGFIVQIAAEPAGRRVEGLSAPAR
jgi:biopolymer transport protein ExbD